MFAATVFWATILKRTSANQGQTMEVGGNAKGVRILSLDALLDKLTHPFYCRFPITQF
jgi:hypothetical protein